ncbi:hypothetical protein [Microcoleus sp. PH2017_32_RDM_D_A]|uniref:hypothetical protein n=1 Tax=Microcoleus sp. PH2017_32_RDM_D_A TaxID=2798842 RepID=UPI001D4B34BF|nr:hypothetical protein [Microcoleus sp. PH2017_32_RDM_D_A]MCC3581649.1 hypothetical protein [Microcoleus sp. PH2017_32_RDM_D_A]
MKEEGRRKKEEGRRKKEEGRRKKEERRRKKEEGRRKKEEGRRKKEEGRRKKEEGRRKKRRKKEGEHLSFASVVLSPLASYTSSHCKKMFFAKMRCSRRKKLNCRVCRP